MSQEFFHNREIFPIILSQLLPNILIGEKEMLVEAKYGKFQPKTLL